MATSKAKKKRLQHVRNGKMDPALHRLDWNGIHPVTRKTPTRQETIHRQMNKHKNKWNPGGKREDSFFVFASSM